MTRAETELLLRRMGDHWDDFGFGLWMADLKETSELIGFVGLQHPVFLPSVADEVEVGWRLGRRFWGHGYATEAGAAAVRHAFEERGLRRLISIIDPANVRSVAVARRLGFSREREVEHPLWPVPVSIYARRPGGARAEGAAGSRLSCPRGPERRRAGLGAGPGSAPPSAHARAHAFTRSRARARVNARTRCRLSGPRSSVQATSRGRVARATQVRGVTKLLQADEVSYHPARRSAGRLSRPRDLTPRHARARAGRATSVGWRTLAMPDLPDFPDFSDPADERAASPEAADARGRRREPAPRHDRAVRGDRLRARRARRRACPVRDARLLRRPRRRVRRCPRAL